MPTCSIGIGTGTGLDTGTGIGTGSHDEGPQGRAGAMFHSGDYG